MRIIVAVASPRNSIEEASIVTNAIFVALTYWRLWDIVVNTVCGFKVKAIGGSSFSGNVVQVIMGDKKMQKIIRGICLFMLINCVPSIKSLSYSHLNQLYPSAIERPFPFDEYLFCQLQDHIVSLHLGIVFPLF